MITSIHHIGIAVRDLDEAIALYTDALGIELTERRLVPAEGVEVAFLPIGEGEIELVRPLEPDNAIARFLDRRGEGLHHICLVVDDIDALASRLKAAGARLLGDRPRRDTHGRRYIFVHPASVHGVLLEFYERSEELDN
jgi:methylmalonyl-CoA/ethylmalonyl-CoA epimerase